MKLQSGGADSSTAADHKASIQTQWSAPQLLKLGGSDRVAGKTNAKTEKTYKGLKKGKAS